ncbi:hypothetical protein KFE25_012118 [Diacronema lutheri]|uniref:CS domain-containing protein n=1 Tax=Diacronema lutheri TaxID=2081491 RepID=A0A8J5XEB5_DIALT|nr:hypothetical protein KFE25_012118 [Diacronema lutheri]
MAADFTTQEERIAFLRARGVEVELPGERRAGAHAPAPAAGPAFTFVCIPADTTVPVSVETAASATGSDVLPALLRPRFADDAAMDEATVARETAARMKGMLHSGGAASALKAPSAAAMAAQAAGGACEAYPLAQPSGENGGRGVRLYIDEVGALRARPRNARAEALAAAAGLAGLAIHGDAYVGRTERASPDRLGSGTLGGETNCSLGLAELAHDTEWVVAARRAHMRAAERTGLGADEHLASGDGGAFSWSQTDDEVEVRVRGAPTGKGASKRVTVAYGRGSSLTVSYDGAPPVVSIAPLFAPVLPDECAWTLDGGEVVVTMPKADARPWAALTLPGA